MPDRETMELDVLFVGAGPAGLAGALRLTQLVKAHDAAAQAGQFQGRKLGETTIGILEKGAEVGFLGISGCVFDPKAIEELLPDYKERGCPIEADVTDDHVLFLTKESKFTLPITPPPLRNHGCHIVSLAKLIRWMAGLCEEAGVQIFPGFAGTEVLYDGDRVAGIRTDDKGIDKEGQRKGTYQPGIDVRAKVTALAEGPRGSLSRELIRRHNLMAGKNPQTYSLGVKEIIEVPPGRLKAGTVWHTMGYPLKPDTFGGAFIYTMSDTLVSIGLVAGLDSPDPLLDPHKELQRLKLHPWLKSLFEGGKVIQYGAKTIPEGGYFSMPRLAVDGAVLLGDSAGFLNSQRLKGVHLAMKSGMMAAEAIYAALVTGDFTRGTLEVYEELFEASWAKQELWRVRNFHQAFAWGMVPGLFHTGLTMALGGGSFVRRLRGHDDYARKKTIAEYYGHPDVVHEEKIPFDGTLIVDKLTDVYLSGAIHDENQPPHLVIADTEICATRCAEEYGNPCTRFCPAQVYEMVEDGGRQKMQLNASNCVHCKSCDIADPYINIVWVTPEGGGGPKYSLL